MKDFDMNKIVNELKNKAEELANDLKGTIENFTTDRVRGFEIVKKELRKFPDVEITLPTRGSKNSAGYDFYSNESVIIHPGEQHIFWTDVKAYMMIGEVLKIYVRSSIGIKKGACLANSVAIIDQDYYGSDNDGNIGICLKNITSNSLNNITINKGERIAQGIFERFLVADSGNTDKERTGGIGSSDKK